MKKWIICLLLFLLPLYFLKNNKKELTPAVEDCTFMIQVNDEEIAFHTYLIGVLAGEMPASFHEEALKAQAIAARTYALKQTNLGESSIQASTAHQVFQSPQKREEKWQAAFAENENKLAQAVHATNNLVLTYNDELITAMFHAASHKQTESAKNYSGNAIPYLQSVPSPETQESEQTFFTFQQLNERLQENFSPANFAQSNIIRNDTQRVEKITINNVEWTGRQFREKLNLRSTNFDYHYTTKGVEIKTYGYGHGVGMSQYGANTMAQNGQTAAQIVAHYYPNSVLEEMDYCTK